MNLRVAIHFAGGCLENFSTRPFCQTKHVDRAMNTSFCGLNGIILVVERRGRTREIEDFVYLDIQRKCDVMAHQFKIVGVYESGNIGFAAREIVV